MHVRVLTTQQWSAFSCAKILVWKRHVKQMWMIKIPKWMDVPVLAAWCNINSIFTVGQYFSPVFGYKNSVLELC